jgi:hypothetical protein
VGNCTGAVAAAQPSLAVRWSLITPTERHGSPMHNRFDDLSRSLQPGSRRRALRTLGALGVAGLIDQFGLTGAASGHTSRFPDSTLRLGENQRHEHYPRTDPRLRPKAWVLKAPCTGGRARWRGTRAVAGAWRSLGRSASPSTPTASPVLRRARRSRSPSRRPASKRATTRTADRRGCCTCRGESLVARRPRFVGIPAQPPRSRVSACATGRGQRARARTAG